MKLLKAIAFAVLDVLILGFIIGACVSAIVLMFGHPLLTAGMLLSITLLAGAVQRYWEDE